MHSFANPPWDRQPSPAKFLLSRRVRTTSPKRNERRRLVREECDPVACVCVCCMFWYVSIGNTSTSCKLGLTNSLMAAHFCACVFEKLQSGHGPGTHHNLVSSYQLASLRKQRDTQERGACLRLRRERWRVLKTPRVVAAAQEIDPSCLADVYTKAPLKCVVDRVASVETSHSCHSLGFRV